MSTPEEPPRPPQQPGPGHVGPWGGAASPDAPNPEVPNPYAPPPGQVGPTAPLDAVSITALVVSLTCVLSLVGFALGFVGLARTSQGRRRGRWAAVTSIVVGAVLSLLVALGFVLAPVISDTLEELVGPRVIAELRVGDCLDGVGLLDPEAESVTDISQVECDGPHDAEVLGRTVLDAAQAEAYNADGEVAVCPEVIEAGPALDAVILGEGVLFSSIVDKLPAEEGDLLLCLAIGDGAQLEGPLVP